MFHNNSKDYGSRTRTGTVILEFIVPELEQNCNSLGYSSITRTGTVIHKVMVPELELEL